MPKTSSQDGMPKTQDWALEPREELEDPDLEYLIAEADVIVTH